MVLLNNIKSCFVQSLGLRLSGLLDVLTTWVEVGILELMILAWLKRAWEWKIEQMVGGLLQLPREDIAIATRVTIVIWNVAAIRGDGI
jgi:hypothetical protein